MSLVGSATAFNYGSMHGGGKQRWLAPELIEPSAFDLENKRPSRASDIFSFGCTCIEVSVCLPIILRCHTYSEPAIHVSRSLSRDVDSPSHELRR